MITWQEENGFTQNLSTKAIENCTYNFGGGFRIVLRHLVKMIIRKTKLNKN